MTTQGYTEICVLTDRSGSMHEIRTDTEGGFNGFIRAQRALPGRCLVSLAQFNDKFEWVYSGQPIADVPNLKIEPEGMTALLDAMGKAIDDFGHRLSQIKEELRPGKVVFVCMTDGLENASRTFTRETVMNKVLEQQQVYAWEFLYLGANQDAIAVGESIGVKPGNSITYTNANAQAAWAATSRAVAGARGGLDTTYTEQERADAVAEKVGSTS